MNQTSMQKTVFTVAVTFSLIFLAQPASAIMLGQIDTFQDGSTNDWEVGIGFNAPIISNALDSGPAGAGDHSLEVVKELRLAVFNETQWSGDWTAAGIARITLNARSLDDTDLTLWLGISQGDPGGGGSGDTYVTAQSQTVPGDGAWHSISFDVDVADWDDFDGTDVATALTNVTHFRVIQSELQAFNGDFFLGEGFQLDNIQAIPEPATSLLLGMAMISVCLGFRRNR